MNLSKWPTCIEQLTDVLGLFVGLRRLVLGARLLDGDLGGRLELLKRVIVRVH